MGVHMEHLLAGAGGAHIPVGGPGLCGYCISTQPASLANYLQAFDAKAPAMTIMILDTERTGRL